jgi:hypothetical protein
MNGDRVPLPPKLPRSLASPERDVLVDGRKSCPQSLEGLHQRGPDCTLAGKEMRERLAIGRSDMMLVMFYPENLFPFFPFDRPLLLQGGRTWILDLMISSPVVKQALLCQSSYFLSLAQGIRTGRRF